MEAAWSDAGLRTAAATALASVAFLGGCGGDDGDGASDGRLSKSDYERQFKAVLAQAEQAPPPESGAGVLRAGRERALSTASELERLRPPAEVNQAHRDYVAALRSVAGDLQRVLRRTGGDKQALREVAERPAGYFTPRTIELAQRSRAAFEEKGYDLGLEPQGATP